MAARSNKSNDFWHLANPPDKAEIRHRLVFQLPLTHRTFGGNYRYRGKAMKTKKLIKPVKKVKKFEKWVPKPKIVREPEL
jgi:hypothetical protein